MSVRVILITLNLGREFTDFIVLLFLPEQLLESRVTLHIVTTP